MRNNTSAAFGTELTKSVTAQCPVGRVRYGVGFSVQHAGTPGLFFPDENTTSQNPGSRVVSAHALADDSPVSVSWSLDVLGICGDQAPGYEILFASNPGFDSTSPKTVENVCPAGKKVHGVGWLLSQLTDLKDVIMEDLVYTGAANTFEIKAAENEPATFGWQIQSRLICAN